MIRSSSARFLVPVIAAYCAWGALGCSVPFGPGYTIEKQRIEVNYSLDAPDHVTVRGWYQLKNTGTQPLDEMNLRLPPDAEFAPQTIRVEWNGKQLPLPDSSDDQKYLRVPLSERWTIGDRGQFAVSYELESPVVRAVAASPGGGSIFLLSSSWYPILTVPRGMLASGGKPPLKWDLVVTMPQGYRVHASGHARGLVGSRSKNGAGAAIRFEQIPLTDFEPFVEAGPYMEQEMKFADGLVILWTSQPVSSARAREIGERVASDEAFFNREFGSLSKEGQTTWIVECPSAPADSAQKPWLSRKGCLTEPQSAVVPREFFSSGASQGLMESVDSQLAATLFHLSVRVAQDTSSFPMSAAGDYAVFALVASRNPDSRGDVVRGLLLLWDSAGLAGEKPLTRVSQDDPEPVQSRANVQSRLFFVALEDRCGAAKLHRAMSRAVRILRGQSWGIADLRSAAEAECGVDLGEFFRQWLARPGIPEDFRARYANYSIAAQQQAKQK